MTMKKRDQTADRSRSSLKGHQSALPTFMEHIRELQTRLFITGAAFILAAGVAYPFFDKIVALIVAPLGKEQELVYLTPSGAFNFMLQVCLYTGVIATLPVITYQIYRFIMPAFQKVHLRKALLFTVGSFVLAIVGVIFAYVVSLPAAIYFLTGFDLYHINPMLTVDSYFSFVMTYLLAGALLFQLPLIMLIINSIRPLTPKKLMSTQKHIILGSFIVSAIISPTPDALNQILLASPVIIMYQLGIVMTWLINRSKRKKEVRVTNSGLFTEEEILATQGATQTTEPKPTFATLTDGKPVMQPQTQVISRPVDVVLSTTHSVVSHPGSSFGQARSMDGFIVAQPRPTQPRKLVVSARQPRQMRSSSVRGLDGFFIPARY